MPTASKTRQGTAKIFRCYSGGITIVTDYVRARKRLSKEVFVPLAHVTPAHDPGHAQVDFGEAGAIIAGVRRKVHYFALDLPVAPQNLIGPRNPGISAHCRLPSAT